MLTAKRVRGLRTIASYVSADLESGEWEEANGGTLTMDELNEAADALSYIYRLASWHEAQKRKPT